MLVLTQMSVGAFVVDQGLGDAALAAGREGTPAARSVQLAAAFGLGMLGLAASIFHLGRPWLAYRAVIGWRRSWLSREVLAFGAFAASASLYAAIPWLEAIGLRVSLAWERGLGGAVALSGLAGVACSTMIYASTRRAFWNPGYTGLKFLLTCLILGIPLAMLIRTLGAVGTSPGELGRVVQEAGGELCPWLIGAAVAKLLLEIAIFGWLKARTFTPLRRTALLMTGDLARATRARFAFGVIGGVAFPGLLWIAHSSAAPAAVHPALCVAVAASLLALNFVGELLERYLFFAAVVAPKMPGSPAA
jgi:DMSO reductase anchor subunit